MTDQVHAPAQAFRGAQRQADSRTTVVEWASLMFQNLHQMGYNLVSSGPEDPLPLDTQGAIELRNIVEKMQAQDFSREEAMQILLRIIERGAR